MQIKLNFDFKYITEKFLPYIFCGDFVRVLTQTPNSCYTKCKNSAYIYVYIYRYLCKGAFAETRFITDSCKKETSAKFQRTDNLFDFSQVLVSIYIYYYIVYVNKL